MTEQEIVDILFKDSYIIKHLKNNDLEECVAYINQHADGLKIPEGYPSIEYIFLDVLDRADIDVLNFRIH